MRDFVFENNEYYHIFNRGVEKRRVFMCAKDYERFLLSMVEFNRILPLGSLRDGASLQALDAWAPGIECLEKLVEIVAYSLLPNHYHLILKQSVENGISKFIHKISMGYANYFNLKYNRSGSLFQGKFKAIPITSDDKLLELSVYINFNAQLHQLVKNQLSYKWSSCREYLSVSKKDICNRNPIFDALNSGESYSELIKEILPVLIENKKAEEEN